jgi:hypothetical protein
LCPRLPNTLSNLLIVGGQVMWFLFFNWEFPLSLALSVQMLHFIQHDKAGLSMLSPFMDFRLYGLYELYKLINPFKDFQQHFVQFYVWRIAQRQVE